VAELRRDLDVRLERFAGAFEAKLERSEAKLERVAGGLNARLERLAGRWSGCRRHGRC
jgi:hypothetical protein